jgi:N-methylhydantoinase A
MPTPPYNVGVDTGGTFTDVALIDGRGRLHFDKAFSTPHAPADGVAAAVARVAENVGEPTSAVLAHTQRFAHGTTVSTNALIERKGAQVGLLTTRGFEDTLIIARGPVGRAGGLPPARAMDFLHTEPPAPLVPRRMTRGLGERVTVTGEIVAALKPEEVRHAIGELLAAGAESLAVCLLWSFRNPAHERMVAAIAREMAPNVPVSLSSTIAPRMGEFERMVTTVVNAFIGPLTAGYITALAERLAADGLGCPVQVMKASGGVMLPARVADEAVSVINSGPIGGLVAARYLGRTLGHADVITADMGGTSFDVGVIADGAFAEDPMPFLDQGLPVLSPSLRVVTIGAGGGSIARTDGFRLHVGPHSAGADPGPACYGRGGERPTVTDALLVLNILDPETFFGGRFALDRAAADRAIGDHVARPLGLDPMAAAAGIYDLVTARMADLIRKVTIESGHDPRGFCLFAYGGATGAHAAVFARQLGIRKVVIPYAAPVFSALGAALSDVKYGRTRSDPVAVADGAAAAATANRSFAELEDAVMGDMAASGIDPKETVLAHRIDLRYEGQMNEVSLDWPGGRLDAAQMDALRQSFERVYERRFGAGTTRRQSPLEMIGFRVDAIRPTEQPALAPYEPEPSSAGPQRRRVYDRASGWTEAEVHAFDALAPGASLAGPAIIERRDTTIWLPRGSRGRLDRFGNIEIEPEAR